MFVEKDATFDGTLTADGIFFFHVTNGGGRVCEVIIDADSPMLKITNHANTTKKQAPHVGG